MVIKIYKNITHKRPMLSEYCKPYNYSQIDNYVSRSAQPSQNDFLWLKQQGVTDVINFRTMTVAGIDFDEKSTVEGLGMKYHNIPTRTRHPQKEQVNIFLETVNNIINNNGKVHIHCMAGADRTGMYSFLYKMTKGLGTLKENIDEWLKMGHHQKLYPDLIPWTNNLLKQLKK